MPLDTNIALGIRPVETPNMLAQMGQMMQMRQMQQGYEQQNNLRDAFAQGTDINDPATFDRIARQDPKLAMELRSKNFDQQQKQTEVGLKRADFLGAAYSGLVKNPTVDNAYSIFDNAVQMGIIPSQAAAAMRAKIDATGGDPRQIAALAQQGIDAAISAKDKMSDATSRANNAATVGASYYGSNVSRDNSIRADERAREGTLTQSVIGDKVYLTNNRTGEIREAMMPESTGGTVTIGAPTTIPTPAPTNALAPQPTGAAPVVNALVQTPAAATPAPTRQPLTTFNPKKVTRETTNAAGDVTQYNERGEVVGVVPKAGKPSAAYEKDLVTEAKKIEGQKTVQTLVSSLADQYKGLLQEGGITSTAQGAMSNIGARSGSSAVGQFAAGFVGTKSQELRDSIAQTRPLIINAIKDSTGMSAQQLNSNVELQNFLKAATDPTLSIEANLKALNNLSKLYGLGTELTMADMKGTPANTGNIATDPTIDALLKKYK